VRLSHPKCKIEALVANATLHTDVLGVQFACFAFIATLGC
jgi:hypothetical protein